ncbi:hypothetical protein GCM10009745_68770 [Kribbella yunnanensis]|uniref:DUF2442 domain-containing protein n=1 Tax=Kribbella yunnanensis TaxID=190194 RepID=A0ABP4USV3_9ACTN
MKARVVVKHPPLFEVDWTILAKGDRVEHFDYGVGTVDYSGPLFIGITWDHPEGVSVRPHHSLIAAFLSRLTPEDRAEPEASSASL